MENKRAYTWCVVTYAPYKEFEPLLDSAKHWAFCLHDQDFVILDDSTKKEKEPHTHIIVTFDREKSFKQVREMIVSDQNTLAQPIRNKDRYSKDSVRGAWRYLIHEGEDETQKHLYEESKRICDDLQYWEHRVKEELDTFSKEDTFFEDLTSTENFSITYMGRKYGRDFIKNMEAYLKFRNTASIETKYEEAQKKCNKINNDN